MPQIYPSMLLLMVVVITTTACGSTQSFRANTSIEAYPTNNEGVADGTVPKGQYNKILTAVSGTVVDVLDGSRDIMLVNIMLDNSESFSLWVSHFWGGPRSWIAVGRSVKVMGAITDIRANVPLWSLIYSDHLMGGICIVDVVSGQAVGRYEECRQWRNGQLPETI